MDSVSLLTAALARGSETQCDETCEFFVRVAIPSVGMLTTFAIYLSPYRAVERVEKSENIGEVNPMPFPLIIANSLAWIMYSMLIQNPFIFIPNILGYPLGIFYTLTCFKYTNKLFQWRIQTILIVSSTVIFTGTFASFMLLKNDPDKSRWIMGLLCTLILSVFYAAPLSIYYRILKKRDSRPLNPLLALASIINGSLWVVYGFSIDDGFVWVPNLVGVFMGIVQVIVMIVFPKRQSAGFTSLRESTTSASEAARTVSIPSQEAQESRDEVSHVLAGSDDDMEVARGDE
eukprot:jgi/Hompol1/1185/HPOL_005529-RA